jgi:hypothetical protein
MRAKFINKFMFCGVEVYVYLDLDTNDFVWLEGGRNGKEMRRIPEPIGYVLPTGRAIDFMPPAPLTKYLQEYHNKINQHIHWNY